MDMELPTSAGVRPAKSAGGPFAFKRARMVDSMPGAAVGDV